MDTALNIVIYPLLFAALYFEVFALLNFFQKEARRRRMMKDGATPGVTIIVPCFNEGTTVKATVDSLLAMDYPKDRLALILVDDGSTDNTLEVMRSFEGNPQVMVMSQKNGGKHTALNAGIALAKTDYVGCMDADSFVTPQALKRVMANFDDEKIGAVTSSMSVHQPRTLLEKMQEAEYLMGIMLRHTMASVNGLYVTPGPFTIYRKKAFETLGSFRSAHQTEDMEIAMRLQRGGWYIQNAPSASVYTKAPKTVSGLIKQRTRWATGFMRNAVDYRDMIGNPKKGVLGLIVLPMAVLSVFSGILVLGIVIFRTIFSFIQGVQDIFDVPLSYTLTHQQVDFFFFPVDSIAILSLVSIVLIFAFIMMGAKIAEKDTRFGLSLVWYFLVYNFIAAAWQIRALFDFATGKKRSWR